MANWPIVEVQKGDTSDAWDVGHVTRVAGKPVVLADLTGAYACSIAVRDTAGAEAMAPRAVTSKNGDNTRFQAWLTPAETAALDVGDYTVGIQISNSALGLVRTVNRRIRITTEIVG